MPRVRDLLYRFRPVGAPGAASAAAVPVDRSAELSAELDPVLARLSDTERACAEIREQGRREAADLRDHDAQRGRDLVASAEQQAEAERAGAAAQVQHRAEDQAAADIAAAEREAADLTARATQRMPEYVQRVVDSVCDLVGSESPEPAHQGVR